jgi:protein-S-isoprenylcysteine O-methyltransferase Ste14
MPPYVYLQIIFFLSEVSLLLFKRSKNSGEKNNKDRRSLLILWIVIFVCFTVGPFSAAYGIWRLNNYETLVYIGMAICIIGFAIRWTAIVQLGRMFTVDVAITDNHTLKTSGLYNIVRHPSYLGLLLIIAGLAICLDSVLSFLIVFIPSFWAISNRIAVEEQALISEFGEQYISYKKRVSKIIPKIY